MRGAIKPCFLARVRGETIWGSTDQQTD